MATTAVKKKTGSMKAQHVVSRVLIYALLIVVAALMLIPFLWMLSASFKLNKDVFTFPIEWIPSNPRPQNYVDIWTKIPLLTFVKNTAFLTIIVTILQVLTSSFAAYAFAKLNFKGKNVLFLGYIATIAVPWQAYMVPQFMMMRSWHLNNTHLAIICLQAFSAFGVFMMKQFYEGVPTELCEAARIDGLSEYVEIRPRHPSPTGAAIARPVSTAFIPRTMPSVELIATVRTTPSPKCCMVSQITSTGTVPSSSLT